MIASPESAPTPWATGLALTAFSVVTTVVTVDAFGRALAHIHPMLAVLVNLVAVAGATPTVWAWLRVPVLRWVAGGIVAGVPIGWFVLVVS